MLTNRPLLYSPLCIEEFDLSDKNFKPCPCGYQVYKPYPLPDAFYVLALVSEPGAPLVEFEPNTLLDLPILLQQHKNS